MYSKKLSGEQASDRGQDDPERTDRDRGSGQNDAPFVRQNLQRSVTSQKSSKALEGEKKVGKVPQLPSKVQSSIFFKAISAASTSQTSSSFTKHKQEHLLENQTFDSSSTLKKVKEESSFSKQKSSDSIPAIKSVISSSQRVQPVKEVSQSQAELVKVSGKEQATDATDIPRQKEFRKGGTRGKEIIVETNHLELQIRPKYDTAIHYDVVIEPDKPKRLLRRVWEQYREQYLKNCYVAFDDVKNAYSPELLPFGYEDSGEVHVIINDDSPIRPYKYRVVLKYARTINLRTLFDYMANGCTSPIPQDALQCIDIVLRNVSSVRFIKVGRSYFSPPEGQIVKLGDGLEIWRGHFQSVAIGWKPFLNINVVHKGFPTAQHVLALMEDIAQQNIEDINFTITRHKISQFLTGLRIQYQLPGLTSTRRSFRVNGLVEIPSRVNFVSQTGQQISVQTYFEREKHYKIRYPNVPCLHVGPLDRKIFLPSELCTILPGQVVNKKLNESQTSNIIRNSATSTDRQKNRIMSTLQKIDFNADSCIRAFGLHIGDKFEKVKARVLNPPDLQYKDVIQKPSKGVWRANSFYKPEKLESWTVINMDRRTRDEKIDEFVRYLMNAARQQGMQIGQPTRPYPKINEQQLQSELWRYKHMKLLFIVIPDYPTNIYSKVKQVAELSVGCLTQCIRSKTMLKINSFIIGNILLKVNAKLNGLNHTIANVSRPPCLRAPCIIMGADVTHPPPEQNNLPSIAAVTANNDATALFQYNFCWRLQSPKQEIITDLENIVREQLMFFYIKTSQKPQRIFFFRDGVSEGAFQQVMNTEIQAIRNACNKMGTPGSYKPPITFLVVQKRHHTRLFPASPNETDDKNCNVRAGTIVDTIITHPTSIEYYLVSHASIQGVARPTKYRVLWDDTNMSEDEIETLTYYLCHMFCRCTRSISYPAPTYYAHLAAFRTRSYFNEQRISLDNLPREQQMRTIKDDLLKDKPMFFV